MQKPWMKEFIDFNTSKRKLAYNDFEKDLNKLMNNAVYGKTMESVRNRMDFRLLDTENEAHLLNRDVNNGNFKEYMLIGMPKLCPEDCVKYEHHGLVLLFGKKSKIVLNKPIYVGATVLDDSKLVMYNFHYNYIQKKYPVHNWLYMDTDSLIYHIQTDNIYEDIFNNREHFDLSDYPAPFTDKTNAKVVKKFKDEFNMTPIVEFVGLSPKVYSCISTDVQNYKTKVKGVSSKHKHEEYKKCLFENTTIHASTRQIRSYDHDTFIIELEKISLKSWNDKRVYVDNWKTHAHGFKKRTSSREQVAPE